MQDEIFVADLELGTDEIDRIPLAICTPTVGADHDLILKLQAIAAAGFAHIELGMPDLVSYAEQHLGSSFKGKQDYDSLEQVAKTIRSKCADLGLVRHSFTRYMLILT